MKNKFPLSELFPPETIRERRAFLKAFWEGADIGRPVFIPVSWENKSFDGEASRTPARKVLDALRYKAYSPVDVVPSFSTGYGGTVSLASAFGGKTFKTENDQWHVEPVVRTPDDAMRISIPDSPTSGFLKEGFQQYEEFLDIVDMPIPPKVPDMQGPLQTASMLWDSSEFLMAMYDTPEAVHHTLNVVTEHIIRVIRFFVDNYEDAELMVYPPSHLPRAMGCAIVEDYTHLLSPELYEEFGLPYVNRISDTFGGVFIHCCAQFKQHWPVFKKIHNLCGLDTMYPFTKPEEIYEEFPDIVHSVGVDYAEVQRSFKDKCPDFWIEFMLGRTPPHIRWQIVVECDKPDDVNRNLALVESRRRLKTGEK